MPIYEYRCTSCGHELEALQKLSDPRLVTCPACSAEALIKKVSAAGFQLKGSGWYATDFRNSGAAVKKPADAKTTDGKAGEAKTDAVSTTAETKAETKTETTPAKTTTPAP